MTHAHFPPTPDNDGSNRVAHADQASEYGVERGSFRLSRAYPHHVGRRAAYDRRRIAQELDLRRWIFGV